MRRAVVLLIVPLLAACVLAGCGGKAASHAASPRVKVSGGFGRPPVVRIPAQRAADRLTVRTLVRGTGPILSATDSFVANYAIYLWNGPSHRLLQTSFTGAGAGPALFTGTLLPGLKKAVVGQRMGSRVLAVIPPKDGFGPQGNPRVGVEGTDTLVFVVDMIKDFAANAAASGRQVSSGGGALPKVTAATGGAPKITVPKTTPPASLVVRPLIKGTGPAVARCDVVVVQYVGELWRNGQVFDSSWARGRPFSFTIGATPSQVIPGWDKGLLGQTVGSRVLLVVPPADGYGKAGSPGAHITGTDTLVFAVDVLGAFHGASTC